MTMTLRRCACWVAAGWALLAPTATGADASPEDPRERIYRDAYSAVIRAEEARDAGSREVALTQYTASLRAFRELGEKHPGFRAEIVESRTKTCIREIRALLKQDASPKAAEESMAALLDAPVPHYLPPADPPAAKAEAPAAKEAVRERELRDLQRRVEQMTRDHEKASRKLAAQVTEAERQAALDREAREAAEKKLAALEKENRNLLGRVREVEEKLPKPPAAKAEATGKEASSGGWRLFGRRSKTTEDKGKPAAVVAAVTNPAVLAAAPPAPPPDPVRRTLVTEAWQCMRRGELDRAYELAVAGRARYPADNEIQAILGMIQCRMGRFADAVKTLKPLVDRDPTDARARVALGAAFIALGQYIDARMELLAAVGFDPDMSEAHYNLAQVLLWGKPSDPESARDHYRQAVKLGAAPDPAFDLELERALSAGRPAAAPSR